MNADDRFSETTFKIIGRPIDRVDGRLKVTGAARYAAEFALPRLSYAVMVQSTVPSGRIATIDTRAAERSPGVLLVMTHQNAPALPQRGRAAVNPPAGRVMSLLQDDVVTILRVIHGARDIIQLARREPFDDTE